MKDILAHWKVEGNEIVNDGKGLYLTTEKEFADYELHLEYKMLPKGDSGIYLKYTPKFRSGILPTRINSRSVQIKAQAAFGITPQEPQAKILSFLLTSLLVNGISSALFR